MVRSAVPAARLRMVDGSRPSIPAASRNGIKASKSDSTSRSDFFSICMRADPGDARRPKCKRAATEEHVEREQFLTDPTTRGVGFSHYDDRNDKKIVRFSHS